MSQESHTNSILPRSFQSKAYNWLKTQILSGQLGPNTRLIETDLSRQLGISRVPLREALSRLTQEGLIISNPGRGAAVRPVTEKDVIEAYLCRAVLERLAAGLAADRADIEEFAPALQQTIDLATKAMSNNDWESAWRANGQFHDILIDTAGNEKLSVLMANLQLYTGFYRRYMLKTVIRSVRAAERYEQRLHMIIDEHGQILAAIRRHQVSEAEELMYQHVLRNREMLVGVMQT